MQTDGLVLNRDYGIALKQLSKLMHVWAIDSPSNRIAAEAIWSSRPVDPLLGPVNRDAASIDGIVIPAASRQEQLASSVFRARYTSSLLLVTDAKLCRGEPV